MVDVFHIHLGYEVTVSISHHGRSTRIDALFISYYIIHLVCHLGIFQGTDQMRVVGGVDPMSLKMLHLMRMVHKVQTIRGTEYWVRLPMIHLLLT